MEGRKRRFHPRRFDGCVTCKKHRVKCAREKPICARCRRLNLECVYAEKKIWTIETSHTEVAPKSSPSTDVAEWSLQCSYPSNIQPSVSKSSTALLAKAMQNQLLQQLYGSIVPSEASMPRMDQLQWFETVVASPQKGLALEQILNAMALKRIAFLHNDIGVDQAGSKAYLTALKTIQSRLTNETTIKSDDTIAAVRAAYTYEQLFPSDDGVSASAHWKGLQQLVASGEPRGGWEELGRASVRSTLTAQGQNLLRDASEGSMTPLLASAITKLDVQDITDAIRLGRSSSMILLISLGAKIRHTQRIIRDGVHLTSQKLQELESDVTVAERALYTGVLGYDKTDCALEGSGSGSSTVIQNEVRGPKLSLDLDSTRGKSEIIYCSHADLAKIFEDCFFKLWFADLLQEFESKTGTRYDLPSSRSILDPARRIALSLRLTRAHERMVTGPEGVLLALDNAYALCLAHKTLTECAPQLAAESAKVIQKSIHAGNGGLKYHMERAARGEMRYVF